MKNRLILLLIIILCLVSVTYSWILSGNPVVEAVAVDYTGRGDKGNLTIAPKDIEMEIYIPNESGNYVKADSTVYLNGMLPNKTFPFKIRFKNHSQSKLNVRLYLQNVTVNTITSASDLTSDLTKPNKNSLIDVLAFGCSPGYGFYDDLSNIPPSHYSEFCDNYEVPKVTDQGVNFVINLAQGIKIPPTKGDDYVELLCYFKMIPDADNVYMGQSIKIGNFISSVL